MNTCYAQCLDDCKFHDGLQIDIFVFKEDPAQQKMIETEQERYDFKMDVIFPLKTIQFEGLTFPAPNNMERSLHEDFEQFGASLVTFIHYPIISQQKNGNHWRDQLIV